MMSFWLLFWPRLKFSLRILWLCELCDGYNKVMVWHKLRVMFQVRGLSA